MADAKEDPIKEIANSPLKGVIVKGLAQVYRVRPAFPIEFLGKWLKNFSKNQGLEKELEDARPSKEAKIAELQKNRIELGKKADDEKNEKQQNQRKNEDDFVKKVTDQKYLSDLLVDYLPNTIEDFCNRRGTKLTGCYVGELKHRHKKLQENNFEPGAELDIENPKIIQYIGASKSHQFMISQILPNETGRSYEVFKEEEPPAEQPEQGKPLQVKKRYLYIPQVQRDDKMYFFKFPKLGSYACFPLKVKSCLYIDSFEKGIGDYKKFVRNKEEVEKEYNEKLGQAKSNFQQAKRRYEEHELNQEDPASQADHTAYQEEMTKSQAALKEIQDAPPVIEPFQYDTKLREYIIGADTMGRDSQIPYDELSFIQSKLDFFRQKWEQKQYKMLLDDVLAYIEDENSLQNQDNYFKDQQRSIIGANEGQIREQFPNREKQPEYELTLLKVGKLIKLLQEQAYLNSMNVYLNYNIPRYPQSIQIILMILGHKKEQINLPRSNTLNTRKCLRKEFIEKMLVDIEKYELRRESSQAVESEYKINKLLQRLEKLDGEAVGRYNSWLYALLAIAKSLCWARIQCRDAKIENHEAKTKAMQERDAEIVKYEEDLEKAIENAKAEVTEETPPFNEEEFLKTYIADNPKPQKLSVEELKEFLDIQ